MHCPGRRREMVRRKELVEMAAMTLRLMSLPWGRGEGQIR